MMKKKPRWEKQSLYTLFVKHSRGQSSAAESLAVTAATADRRPGGFKSIYKVGDRLVVR
ncbi:hypothetical protein [Duganella vulcania]|uniref:Uncharacterized protein n=1 Tax=Duganella vulcania TaxID=2692166 RepID=A0A845GDU7_9BURK|nr:hypothetical protein [Duganella vulcania]MYM92454.1 hypothetical protein [Duganella vulcania]